MKKGKSSDRDRRYVTFPPGPYRVEPPSQTAGWGTCVGNGREIVARIPGRDKAKVQAIARLMAASPELLAEVQRIERQLATSARLLACVAADGSPCLHCELEGDRRRLGWLVARVAGY